MAVAAVAAVVVAVRAVGPAVRPVVVGVAHDHNAARSRRVLRVVDRCAGGRVRGGHVIIAGWGTSGGSGGWVGRVGGRHRRSGGRLAYWLHRARVLELREYLINWVNISLEVLGAKKLQRVLNITIPDVKYLRTINFQASASSGSSEQNQSNLPRPLELWISPRNSIANIALRGCPSNGSGVL